LHIRTHRKNKRKAADGGSGQPNPYPPHKPTKVAGCEEIICLNEGEMSSPRDHSCYLWTWHLELSRRSSSPGEWIRAVEFDLVQAEEYGEEEDLCSFVQMYVTDIYYIREKKTNIGKRSLAYRNVAGKKVRYAVGRENRCPPIKEDEQRAAGQGIESSKILSMRSVRILRMVAIVEFPNFWIILVVDAFIVSLSGRFNTGLRIRSMRIKMRGGD
jgi:hypothetical protein